MCGDASVWADQSRRLSLQFRCITYDRRGHSRSPLGDVTERTVELQGSGHVTYAEKPDEFADAVASFAADTYRTPMRAGAS